ncbi:MAG TPA: GtrA family protein [Gammaproteobacteria bacterium]|jgi:Predicted membrane protein
MTAACPGLRFALVGVANLTVSFAVFWICVRHPPFATLHATIANALAYLAGMVNSFFLNRAWTFRVRGSITVQAVRFSAVNLLCAALTSAVVYALVDVLRYPELAVWGPLTVVAVLLNYVSCKRWVFAAPRVDLSRRS